MGAFRGLKNKASKVLLLVGAPGTILKEKWVINWFPKKSRHLSTSLPDLKVFLTLTPLSLL